MAINEILQMCGHIGQLQVTVSLDLAGYVLRYVLSRPASIGTTVPSLGQGALFPLIARCPAAGIRLQLQQARAVFLAD